MIRSVSNYNIKNLYEKYFREADLQWDFDDEESGPAKSAVDPWSKRDKPVSTSGKHNVGAKKKTIDQVRTLPSGNYPNVRTGSGDVSKNLISFPEDVTDDQVKAWDQRFNDDPDYYESHAWVFTYDRDGRGEFEAENYDNGEILTWDDKKKRWV